MIEMSQKVNYHEYIKSKEWYERTEPIRIRNNFRCEVCNMRFGEHVHHRSYERLGHELMADLIHVCDPCHKIIHGIYVPLFFIWPERQEFLKQLTMEAIANGTYRQPSGKTD